MLRRAITAQILNALALNPANTFVLLQYDILKTIYTSVASVSWQRTDNPSMNAIDPREYQAMQQLMEFLVKAADVAVMIPEERKHQYRARDWARESYRVCHVVLDPQLSDVPAPRDMKQSIEHVFSACFMRINAKRSPQFNVEHACAVFEVPGFLQRLVHWFYRREHLRQPNYGESAELITCIIDALQLARTNDSIPLHHKKTLAKALHFNQACASCNARSPDNPLLETCPLCLSVFYCNEECRTSGFRQHTSRCPQAWKADMRNQKTH